MDKMKLKTAQHLNLITFEMADKQMTKTWVDKQLSIGRHVFRDVNDKGRFTLFSTDLADKVRIRALIIKRFQKMFQLRAPKLVELTSTSAIMDQPLPVAGPAIEEPGRPLTVPHEKTPTYNVGSAGKKMPERIVYDGRVYVRADLRRVKTISEE